MQSLNSQQIADIASKLAGSAVQSPVDSVPVDAGSHAPVHGPMSTLPSSSMSPGTPRVSGVDSNVGSPFGSFPFTHDRTELPNTALHPSALSVSPSAQPTFAIPDFLPVSFASAVATMSQGNKPPTFGHQPSTVAPAAPVSKPDLTHDGRSANAVKTFVAAIRGQSILNTTPNHFGLPHSGSSFGSINNPDSRTSKYRSFDPAQVRRDFPALHQSVHGRPLIWLDNAATTHKPQCVIDTLAQYYSTDYSNIHRAAHTLAARSTERYESARDKVRDFIGAGSSEDIVFVRGTTEGINLVANTLAHYLRPGDEIVLSTLEHHANIVPWQMVSKITGAKFRIIPINDRGEIMLEDYRRLLGPRTKVVALTHASNSLGTIPPVAEMTQLAHRVGARVLIDGAQSVPHMKVNVQEIGSDFYVFSGHKVFGPTGIGAVYMSKEMQEMLPPWQGGGNMIRNVTFEETEYADAPAKFEAGTPNIADAIGLGAAIDYVSQFEPSALEKYEHSLLEYATERLGRIPGLSIIGQAAEKVGVVSFVLANRKTEQVGKQLDREGIAVRAGHHCAQPSLRRYGVETTVRPSFSFYNTFEEIDALVDAVRRLA